MGLARASYVFSVNDCILFLSCIIQVVVCTLTFEARFAVVCLDKIFVKFSLVI